jgi:glutamate racemase
VEEVAAPGLVPLVEAGITAGDEACAAVESACAPFRAPLDALVLACTHFPFLDAHFAAVLGPAVVRIDPSTAQADRAVAFARSRAPRAETGRTRYVTTGALDAFREALPGFVGALDPEDAVEEHHRGRAEHGAAHDL